MARRFEIPRDVLNELKNIEDPIARFSALKDVLADFGITEELIAAQTQTTAVAFDKLGGAADDAFAALGQAGAKALRPLAEDLTAVLQAVTNGINSLSESGSTQLAITNNLIAASQSVDEFNARVTAANTTIETGLSAGLNGLSLQLVSIFGHFDALKVATDGIRFDTLTEQAFVFAQTMQQSGASIQEINTALQGANPTLKTLEDGFKIAGESANITREQLNAFEQAVLQAASTGEAGATFATALAQALLRSEISAEEATAKLQAYAVAVQEAALQQQAAANAEAAALDQHERATQGIQNQSTALGEQAIKSQESAVETQRLKDLQADLARLAGAVSAGHISNGQAAAFLASQYGLASGEAARLLSLQAQLAGANAAAGGVGKGKGVSRGGIAADFGGGGAQTQSQRDKIKRDQEALVDSEIALANAKGNTAAAIDLLRQKQKALNTTTAEGQAEFNKLQAQIIGLQNKGAKGGGAKSPKLTANEKLHNQLLTAEDKFDNQMEDLEEKHQQKLLDIIQDFAEKQLAVQKENEVLKRRSRFDFYSDLTKSQIAPIDKEKFAAAYEQAFAKAQEIAQSGRAQLAQEFLAMKQKHIQELKELAEEEANIKSDKDISGDERKRQLEELEGRRKLLLDAQTEEEKQLLEGGDKLQNDFNKRIDDENKAYEDQADRIATAADRAGEAKIRNAERSKIKVDEENKALAEQLDAYRKIAELNGGKLPNQPTTPTATTPVATPTTPIEAPQPLPVKPEQPLPVEGGGATALTVQGVGLFIVRDQGVIDAIGDQTARLEGKLDLLNTTMNAMNTTLGGKIDNVRSAIGSWKGGNAVRP